MNGTLLAHFKAHGEIYSITINCTGYWKTMTHYGMFDILTRLNYVGNIKDFILVTLIFYFNLIYSIFTSKKENIAKLHERTILTTY